MKKLLCSIALFAFLGMAQPAEAQVVEKTKKGVKEGWKGTKKAAKKVGNETAEKATQAKAKTTDKKSDMYEGPDGQAVYVDDGNKYYWINERGGREFLTTEQLKKKVKVD